MATILFLAHRIPYPPNKGDKIRSWHFLSHLIEHHDVHLGFYVDDLRDLQHIDFLRKKTASMCFDSISPKIQKLRSLTGLFSGSPLTLAAYPKNKLQNYVENCLDQEDVDLIFAFSAATTSLVPVRTNTPLFADLVDVDSEKWASYSQQASWPLSWLYKREAETLSAYEAYVADRSVAASFVSEQEAALFKAHHPKMVDKIYAIPNGVDLEKFKECLHENTKKSPVILFSGAMNYLPNIEAVEWFCKDIWPLVIIAYPHVKFRIAGGPTPSRVQNLGKIHGVEVGGYVDDMAHEIAQASVCIAPMKTARGIQNKVLEAMAVAKPVVATSLANEGINALDKKQLFVADEAQGFASAILDLLANTKVCEEVGKAARFYVEEHFTWRKAFLKLDRIMERYI